MHVLFLFLLIVLKIYADSLCCLEEIDCIVPNITVEPSFTGIYIDCGQHIDCAWVERELDTCSCGKTWSDVDIITWDDSRLTRCFHIEKNQNTEIHGIIRWWSDSCMGHQHIDIDINILPDFRDTFMNYTVLQYQEVKAQCNNYTIYVSSGSEDQAPQADKSIMFFKAIMKEPYIGVHLKIIDCQLEILKSGAANAEILTTYPTNQHAFHYNISYAEPHGEIVTYKAFMDEVYYSPWQRIMCTYGLYNGSTSLETYNHNNAYMILNPFDSGIIHS